MDFKVNLLANVANIAVNDHNGIVNGSYSFLKHFDIKLNGKKVYDCNDANHAVNIKNLLDYSLAYAEITASNEFFFLDTSRNAGEREFEVSGTKQLAKRRAAYNKGFALRKVLLGTSSTVNTEIPLNRYSFFEMLGDELLPNTRVEMNFEIESGGNLIWQAGADCRVAIPRMQSYVPRITFNSKGQSSYMSQYLKNHAWSEVNTKTPSLLHEIANEVIWNNKLLCINKKSVYRRDIADLGFLKICDLFSTKENLNPEQGFFIMGIINSMPASWRLTIKRATTAPVIDPLPDSPCLLYTSPSPRDGLLSRMPSSA